MGCDNSNAYGALEPVRKFHGFHGLPHSLQVLLQTQNCIHWCIICCAAVFSYVSGPHFTAGSYIYS